MNGLPKQNLTAARKTVERFVERATRLYEQEIMDDTGCQGGVERWSGFFTFSV